MSDTEVEVSGKLYDGDVHNLVQTLIFPPETRLVLPEVTFQVADNKYELWLPTSNVSLKGFQETVPVFVQLFHQWITVLKASDASTWTEEDFAKTYENRDWDIKLFPTIVSFWNGETSIPSDYLFYSNTLYEQFRLIKYAYSSYFLRDDYDEYSCNSCTICSVVCIESRSSIAGTYVLFTTRSPSPIYCVFLRGNNNVLPDLGGAEFMELNVVEKNTAEVCFFTDQQSDFQTYEHFLFGKLQIKVDGDTPRAKWETERRYQTVPVGKLADLVQGNEVLLCLLHPRMAGVWYEGHFTQPDFNLQREMSHTTTYLPSETNRTCSVQ